MFARVSRFQGAPEGVQDAAEVARERVLPAVRDLAGSAGMLILADRETGRSIGITLWTSEQAMRDTEQAADGMRSDTAEASGEEIVGVERYEIVLDERWDR